MTPLETLLILIGAGILICSFFLVDKSTDKTDPFSHADTEVLNRELSLAEIAEIKKKIDSILTEITEEIIVNTEDSLSQISNEKIIAVNDFSNQVMEKISQNHEEVIFLYNMLNEKERELKDTIKQVASTQKHLLETEINDISNKKTRKSSNESHDENSNDYSKDSSSTKAKENLILSKHNSSEIELSKLNQFNQITNESLSVMSVNNNEKILKLYSQGQSIIEISKILGLGQGEVKLVIDLFREK